MTKFIPEKLTSFFAYAIILKNTRKETELCFRSLRRQSIGLTFLFLFCFLFPSSPVSDVVFSISEPGIFLSRI